MKKLLAGCLIAFASVNANATLIEVNGGTNIVNTIDIAGSSSSFLDFYNFNTGVPNSSNTGLEIFGELTVFITELNNELGIFALTKGGTAGLDLALTSTAGAISFIEEDYELTSPNNISWEYYGNKGDGFIFSGITTSENFQLDFAFSNLNNITNYSVLDFTGGSSTPTSIVQGSLVDGLSLSVSSNIPNVVSAPAIASLFGFAGLLMLARRNSNK